MPQNPETPGGVFAEALQQWRDALRPGDEGGTPPSPNPPLSSPDGAHDPK